MKMKSISVALTLILSFAAQAANATESDNQINMNRGEIVKLMHETAAEMDPAVLDAMKKNLDQLLNAESEGMKKMSNDQMMTTILSCVTGNGAILAGLRFGICLDSRGRVYTLTGASGGFSVGAKGSLVFGVAKSTGSIRGKYKGVTIGGASPNKALHLGQYLRSLNVGLGLDVVYGTSPRNDTIVLVGPALGSMIDLSGADFEIN